MEHEHKFEIDSNYTSRDGLEIIVSGSVNGTLYGVKTWAEEGDNHCRSIAAVDLKFELAAFRPELSDADYEDLADELSDACQEYADDYCREMSIRYTPA